MSTTLKKTTVITNYLLIELANVVVGLPLGLDVHGVVLDTFGCGHDWLSTDEKNQISSESAANRTSRKK